jgi:hypothetical protein
VAQRDEERALGRACAQGIHGPALSDLAPASRAMCERRIGKSYFPAPTWPALLVHAVAVP